MKAVYLSILSCLLAALPALAMAADTTSHSPVGYWRTTDPKTKKASSIVQIFESNGELRGRVEKLINSPEKNPICNKCPGNKKNKPILGLEFLWGFRRAGAGWTEGKVLDPDSGKVYDASMEVIDSGKRLKLFGYTRVVVKIGETEIWERVSRQDVGATAQ